MRPGRIHEPLPPWINVHASIIPPGSQVVTGRHGRSISVPWAQAIAFLRRIGRERWWRRAIPTRPDEGSIVFVRILERYHRIHLGRRLLRWLELR
jgi:hypothetical protein